MACNANGSDQIHNIHIHCCNNIESGTLKIHRGKLNIKYGINGTGKSTIAKAIEFASKNNGDGLNQLVPFKYLNSIDENHRPKLEGVSDFSNVTIFDERYVRQYVFLQDELIKDSFEVFVKSPKYDQFVIEIEKLISDIADTFRNDPELDSILDAFNEFIIGFGKATSGYSASSSLAKGIGNKGNLIANIPESLIAFSTYLKNIENGTNVKWIKWQQDGKTFLEMAEQCPYCTAPVELTRDTILKVSEIYNPKDIEHLNKMLSVFEQLAPFFSPATNDKIRELSTNSSGLAQEQQEYLLEIKKQVDTMRSKLLVVKSLNSSTIRDLEKIARDIEDYKIDFSVFSHLQTPDTKSKIQKINDSLDIVLSKAGELQGKVNQQKLLIRKTINEYSTEINNFLQYAGYRYEVSIAEKTDKTFKLLLKHKDNAQTVGTVKNHLSFGEQNAFALVLFMYSALKADNDLIILDDPVSSFDGNKQFAILNMLFMGHRCFKDKTVLVLTHEFNFVIDSIYNLSHKIKPPPKASCLQTSRDGILTELEIKKDDIKSAFDIAQKNIADSSHILCKLVHLRRLYEITDSKKMGWQLISNVLKKRDIPYYYSNEEDRPMQEDEINEGINEIHKRIPEFSLNEVMHLVTNQAELLKIYEACIINYEKLQIYRIINNNNSSNDVIKKFVNEAFHIENDYLFQLNPYVYDSVPHYVIDECDKDLRALSEEQER